MNLPQTILTDELIGPFITQQIRNAAREVVIVSPYVKPWAHVERVLMEAGARGVKRTLLYRTGDLKVEPAPLKRMFDTTHAVDLLHAKIYFFDDAALLSSMNLLDHSQQASREVALVILDAQQKQELRSYVQSLIRSPQLPSTRPTPVQSEKPKTTQAPGIIGAVANMFRAPLNEDHGYCIRCRALIDWEPERPYCRECYYSWNQYGNPYFTERVCHTCGKPWETSMERPECKPCYYSD